MKLLVLIVCVLNVLLFFWELHNGALKSQPPRQMNLPTILLAEEAARAQRGAVISAYLDQAANSIAQQATSSTISQLADQVASATSIPNIAAPQAQTCYEFGPFPNLKAANAWLAGQGFSGRMFYKPELVPSSYLVYAPLEKDPAQRRIFKQMLIEKGVKDFFILASGELKGYMSFGVFNDMPHASHYQQDLAERGVQAQIKERYVSRSSLFVGFSSGKAMKPIAAGVVEAGCR
jgi:hypothetical protein